jgi:RNA polymerase sigma-70 factor (ECF subfamily)
LATEKQLSDFLKSVEKRAFKRSVFHVRNDDVALDIVQDSMLKLAEHYGDKPVEELPMLFQRILSNCTLDWFRKQKRHNEHFSNLNDFLDPEDDSEEAFDNLAALSGATQTESAETSVARSQMGHEIEKAIETLPVRQREAFLMRYWEELDLSETAAAMGCTVGSVKTHCSRAIAKLGLLLAAKGIHL